MLGILNNLGASRESLSSINGSSIWFLGVNNKSDSLISAQSHSSELRLAVELIIVHGWVGLDVGVLAADGVDEAGGGGAVVVDGFAVEILEAQGDAVGDGDTLSRGDDFSFDGGADEAFEGGLLTAGRRGKIGSNTNRLIIILSNNLSLLIGSRERILIRHNTILLLWIELNGSAEGVQRVQALLKAVRLLGLDGLSMVIIADLKVGGLNEDQVSTGWSTTVLTGQAVVIVVVDSLGHTDMGWFGSLVFYRQLAEGVFIVEVYRLAHELLLLKTSRQTVFAVLNSDGFLDESFQLSVASTLEGEGSVGAGLMGGDIWNAGLLIVEVVGGWVGGKLGGSCWGGCVVEEVACLATIEVERSADTLGSSGWFDVVTAVLSAG